MLSCGEVAYIEIIQEGTDQCTCKINRGEGVLQLCEEQQGTEVNQLMIQRSFNSTVSSSVVKGESPHT